jgi:hypothetical protein
MRDVQPHPGAWAYAPRWRDGTAILPSMQAWRSWSLIGLVVAIAVIVAVVIGAVFSRQAIRHTAMTGQRDGVLVFALLCSLISFALLEIAKRLLPVRQYVQESYLRQWWDARARAAAVPAEDGWEELMGLIGIRPNRNPFIIRLVTRQRTPSGLSYDDPIFGLPIQLLAAQISNAADLAVTDPSRYPQVYFALTRSADDARVVRTQISEFPSGRAEDEALRDFNRHEAYPPRSDTESFQLAQRARGAIDSLQLSVGERWRRSVQASGVLVAALAGLLIQLAHPSDSRWLYVLAATLIGGPLAWTIRDLAAAIERWRR